MSRNPFSFLKTSLVLIAVAAFTLGYSYADTVILKSGEKFEGEITYESNILVKIAVKISESINETKTIARDDIAEIIKVAPDAVAFNEIQKGIPTRSLMKAADYTAMIEKGPTTFKTKFPNSQFSDKVEEIEATLLEELDKVERGFIKLDGQWISRQEQLAREMLIQSRIRKFRYNQYAAQGNFIGALREFNFVEKNANGTPAHAEMAKTLPDVLRGYGSFLSKKMKNVDYLNAQDAEAQQRLDPTQLAQVQKARANEVARFEALAVQEKEAGVKWMTVDLKSKEKISEMINLVTAELERADKINADSIAKQAARLEKIDEQIYKGELKEAEEALTEMDITVKKSSKKSSSRKASTYSAHISSRLADAKMKKEEALKQAIAAGDAKELVSGLIGKKDALGGSESTGDAAGEAESGGSALAAAMAAKKKASQEAAAKRAEEEAAALASKEKKDRPKSTKDKEKKDRPKVDSGGGISFSLIMGIVAGLLVIALVVVKVMGIGGKKEGADS